jgi:hypothetical protein
MFDQATELVQHPGAKEIAIHALMAFFGATVHAAKAHRAGSSKTWVDFITLTIMASFSGVIFALVGFGLFPESEYLRIAFTGMGGYLGVEGMTLIIERFRLILSVRLEK